MSDLRIRERLHALRAVHAEVLDRLPSVTGLVFLTPDGHAWPWHTANVTRIRDRDLAAAGVPKVDVEARRIDVHALRHTAGTRLARAGVPLSHAQRLLGHSDPRLTSAVYTHLDADDLRASVDRSPAVAGGQEPAPRRAKETR